MKPYGASDVCRNVLCVRRDAAPTGVECRGFVAREAFARNGHAKARPYFVECRSRALTGGSLGEPTFVGV
jgi:hypothetical protein